MIGQQSIDFRREMHLSGKNKTDSFIEKLIEKNQQIEVLYLSRNLITAAGILHFNKGDWSKLTILSLISNQIGNKGCKLLSKSPLKSIRLIALDDNNIDSAGVLHLSKAKWPELQQGISLCSNKIAFDSCKWINRAKWTPSKIQLQKLFEAIVGHEFCPNLTNQSNILFSGIQHVIDKKNKLNAKDEVQSNSLIDQQVNTQQYSLQIVWNDSIDESMDNKHEAYHLLLPFKIVRVNLFKQLTSAILFHFQFNLIHTIPKIKVSANNLTKVLFVSKQLQAIMIIKKNRYQFG